MTVQAIIELVVVTIVGVLVALTAGIYAVKKYWREFREALNEDGDKIRRKIEATAAVMNGALQDFCEPMQYPCWYKLADYLDDGTVEFHMQYINTAYEVEFGKSKDEYIGRTDYQVWPKDIADAFYRNDAAVLASGKHHRFIENVPIDKNNPSGATRPQEFDKWIIRRNGRIGIAGMMRPVVHPPEAPIEERGDQ